ncbi:OmpA family protein [Paracrocinitomix mangrovi]|uniref:OmpA family protein n=1 Tax=Paracrocinitomix mangrovi TaxID=2862509 RepID=UPI001C8E3E22|nr:OmpA family protein [Paracrocinitomix mangrovi]UKN01139.1 OmpA family protein [Paracrocinitomix mangrovi]
MVKNVLTYCFILFNLISFSQEEQAVQLTTTLKGNVYCPVFYRDKIVVCSDQKDGLISTVIDGSNHLTTNLYMLNGENEKYSRLDEAFKTHLNDGPISFDADGGYAIYSTNVIKNMKLRKMTYQKNPLGLFESKFTSEGWSEPKILPFVDSVAQYTHPGLDAKGTTMVFASNRKGGLGGFDIWISRKTENGWSEPVNAGPGINSDKNELFPSINGKHIYFSSDRPGKGGLDIYDYDTLSKTSKLLSSPINSNADDFGYVQRKGKDDAYFSSNRTGADQIWKIKVKPEVEIICTEMVSNVLCYNLTEEHAAELGEIDALVYKWKINEDVKLGISIDYCFPGEGGYEISLDIIDTIVDVTYYNQSYYYLEIAFEEQPYIGCPDTVKIGEEFEITAEESNLPGVTINNYSWRFNDGKSLKGMKNKYAFQSEGDYQMELTVEGEKDGEEFISCVYKSIHCYKDNLIAAQNSIENVLEDTSKIVEEKQFYDEENDSSKMVYSIEVIRTDEKLENDNFLFTLMETYGEVKIHYIEETDQYSYMVGAWESIEEAHPTWRDLLKNGYNEAVVRSIDLNKISNFSLDNSFVLDNVRFDEGKWDVRKDALPDLENIIEIMLIFPNVDLKIEAHTDSQGPEDYNLELSQKRANSVKNYIISKGVDASRIAAEGKGESIPKASNDTPEGQEINRRVEFTFVK